MRRGAACPPYYHYPPHIRKRFVLDLRGVVLNSPEGWQIFLEGGISHEDV
jgi:hypothetical protein